MKVTIYVDNRSNPSVSSSYQMEIDKPLNLFSMEVARTGYVLDEKNKRVIPWHQVMFIAE